jgi:hypothetical protein
MAPLTFAVGAKNPFAPSLSVVGPVYVGSELFTPVLLGSGCVIVLVGH